MKMPHEQGDGTIDSVENLQHEVDQLSLYLEEHPVDADALYRRGVLYGQLVEPVSAIEDFDQAIHLDQDNAEAYYNRGVAYIHLRQQMPAIEDFTKTIQKDPAHVNAYNNRAAAYFELGNPEQAIQDADQALRLDSTLASAFALKAMAYTHLGQKTSAEACIKSATTLGFDPHLMDFLVRQIQR